MNDLLSFLQAQFSPHADLDSGILREKFPSIVSSWSIAHVYPGSLQVAQNTIYFMVRWNRQRWLVAMGGKNEISKLKGEVVALNSARSVGAFPLNTANADVLRKTFDWLNPKPYGLKPTFGCGDRLGLATPGHIHAARACGVHVLLAQQSIREMARTQRIPREVMDDAMWGVFQEGYTDGFGSDADHLKTFADVDVTAAVGFTMFTIDPSEYVDRAADAASEQELDQKLKSIHTEKLPVPVTSLMEAYAGKTFEIPGLGKLTPSSLEVKRAIVKYGRAVAHTEIMAGYISKVLAGKPYDLEMSVDETDNPTTLMEHLFVGLELKRRKVSVQSLALRFIGEFQKGIDYIGDLKEFEASFAKQFAIAKFCGPYKMSIHSGSDKFSIFPIIGKIAGSLVHEKTAGTSYLEALHVIARVNPGLFREICDYSLERYPTDRATYHVAEHLDQLPKLASVKDADLEKLFENNNARQLLHVTFGSVLNEKNKDNSSRFKDRFFQTLREHEDLYAQLLKAHFIRHMQSLRMAKTS